MLEHIINELESYLSSPMRDIHDGWEVAERRYLWDLLNMLRAKA